MLSKSHSQSLTNILIRTNNFLSEVLISTILLNTDFR